MLSEQQLSQALSIQQEDGRRLGAILLAYGFVAEPQLVQALSKQLSVPWVSLWHVDVPDELLDLVPVEIVKECSAVPVYIRSDRGRGMSLYVAMDDPTNDEAIARVSQTVRMPVVAMVAGPSDIAAAIREFYGEPQAGAVEILASRPEAKTLQIRMDVPVPLKPTVPVEAEPYEELEAGPDELEPEAIEPEAEPEALEAEPAALEAEPAALEAEAIGQAPEALEVEPAEVAPAEPQVEESGAAPDDSAAPRKIDTLTDAESPGLPGPEPQEPGGPSSGPGVDDEGAPDRDELATPVQLVAAPLEEPLDDVGEGEVVTLEEAQVVEPERDTDPPPAPAGEAAALAEPQPVFDEAQVLTLDQEQIVEEPAAEVQEPVDAVDASPVKPQAQRAERQSQPAGDQAGERRPKEARRPGRFALTLLDGTTIELSNTAHTDNRERITSVPELVALLRASARGAPLPKPLPATHWETFVANLIELLVRKRLLDEEEVLESLLR